MLALKMKTVTVHASAENTALRIKIFKKKLRTLWQVNPLQFKSIGMKIPVNNKGTCY